MISFLKRPYGQVRYFISTIGFYLHSFFYCSLKHIPKNKKVCILGDQQHMDEANANGLDCMDADALKKFNKDKKVIKKFAKSFDAFLASDSLIKQIPRILGVFWFHYR